MDVPELRDRPRIPARLSIVFQALRDLGPDPSFDALSEWERRARDPDDRALWILDRLQIARDLLNAEEKRKLEADQKTWEPK